MEMISPKFLLLDDKVVHFGELDPPISRTACIALHFCSQPLSLSGNVERYLFLFAIRHNG